MPTHKGDCKLGDVIVCPYCDADDIYQKSHTSTLVGWFPIVANEDPNHHTVGCECNICEKEFTFEYVIKDQTAWYVGIGDDAWYCLKGMPGCCETSYFITCKKCGGWSKHSRHHQSMCFDNNGPTQAMYYECMNCGDRIEDPRYPSHV